MVSASKNSRATRWLLQRAYDQSNSSHSPDPAARSGNRFLDSSLSYMSASRLERSGTRNPRLSQKWLQAVGALLQSGVLQGPGRWVPSRELEPSPMY